MADEYDSSSDEEVDQSLLTISMPDLPRTFGVVQEFRTHRPAVKLWGGLLQNLVPRHNEYKYDALGRKQIRLIWLLPGSRNDDIQCRLKAIPFSKRSPSPVQYQALSYVWGSDSSAKHIQILDAKGTVKETKRDAFAPTRLGELAYRGLARKREEQARSSLPSARKFYVGANLYAALRQFRPEEGGGALFWIDAICINQQNNEEKTRQLARMHDIYNKASNVCIWLGEADEGGKSRRAMQFIESVVNLRNLDALVSQTDEERGSLKEKAANWDALADLMSSSWFSRRWVVQEVALARRASVHCGKDSTNWVNFADAVAFFVTKLDDVRALYRMADPTTYNPSHLSFVEGLGAKVMTLVSTLLTFDATNPRDIIYALHSLANDSPTAEKPRRHAKSLENSASLQPDYSKDPVEVYTDFVQHCIDSGSLDIICRKWAIPVQKELAVFGRYLQNARIAVPLPSWIGLVNDSPYGRSDRLIGRQNGDCLVGLPKMRTYNASDDESPQFDFIATGKRGQPVSGSLRRYDVTLRCNGLTLRQITRPPSARIVNATLTRECLEMLGWKASNGGESPTTVPDQLWRTLVADRGPDGSNTPSWYHRACLHCLVTSTTGDINTGELIQKDDSPKLMVEYLRRVQRIIWDRTVIVAEAPTPNLVHRAKSMPEYPSQPRGFPPPPPPYETTLPSSTGPVSPNQPGPSSGPYLRGESGSRPSKLNLSASRVDGPASSSRSLRNQGRVLSTPADRDAECLYGLAPKATKADDLICILFGCSVLVILREIKDESRKPDDGKVYHELIGEAYVHGKMDGEALSKYATMEELKEATQEFLLR